MHRKSKLMISTNALNARKSKKFYFYQQIIMIDKFVTSQH